MLRWLWLSSWTLDHDAALTSIRRFCCARCLTDLGNYRRDRGRGQSGVVLQVCFLELVAAVVCSVSSRQSGSVQRQTESRCRHGGSFLLCHLAGVHLCWRHARMGTEDCDWRSQVTWSNTY